MWQPSVLSALIVLSFCPAESHDTKKQGCGRYGPHAVDDDGQINFKSSVAEPNELPWLVTILQVERMRFNYEHKNIETYLSDGVLIHPSAVLVSYHNVQGTKLKRLLVRAGDWDTASNSEPDTQYQTVSKIELAEYKKSEKLQRLVAILILSYPFENAENIGFMCVPRKNDAYDRSRCIVSGWTGGFGDPHKNYPKRVSVPIITHNECRESYVDYNNIHENKIPFHRESICAGSKEHPSMCESNRGSPLICPLVNDPSQYVLVGLDISRFSFRTSGSRCNINDSYLPSQFADVSAFGSWIDRKILDHGMVPSLYRADSTDRRENDQL